MRAVGVKQLKAGLSEYLRHVRAGETILVTDRDEVVAELRPARRQSQTTDDIDEVLELLAEQGKVTLPSVPKGQWIWKPRGLGLPPGSAGRLLDEIRSDR
jgi:antitoxin (DNA-binding transcriptional repressor) of toxin-antitoxin stability system